MFFKAKRQANISNGVVSKVERRTVNAEVSSSIPITIPNNKIKKYGNKAKHY